MVKSKLNNSQIILKHFEVLGQKELGMHLRLLLGETLLAL